MTFAKGLLSVRICSYSDIRHIFRDNHYKGSVIGGGISVCFAALNGGAIVGGAVLGKPRHERKYPNAIDIRRLAFVNDSPCNSESWFLGQIIRWCASNTDCSTVLSYSDKTAGHVGTIYKAANFTAIGETEPTQYVEFKGRSYHMRSLSIDREYSYVLREAVKNGEAVVVTGLRKTIWVFEIPKSMKRKKKVIPGLGISDEQQKMFQN